MKQKLIFIAALCTALSVFSTEYFVDASRPNDTGSATNWATAKKTIQAAVDLTVDGDTVWVTNGIYSSINISGGVAVCSINGAEQTVINGQGTSRCALLVSNAVLRGFTLTNGVAQTGGGVSGGTVQDCVLIGNRAQYNDGCILGGCNGGGAYQSELTRCVIVGNGAYYGGGAYDCFLTECQILSNSTAILITGGLSYEGTLDGYGGGVHSSTLDRCFLRGNSARDGGGGACDSTLRNCVIVGNKAGLDGMGSGGGAHSGILENCTVIGNYAGFGAGVAGCDVENSIVYYNYGADIWSESLAVVQQNVSDSSMEYSCTALLQIGVGNITNAPLFINDGSGYGIEYVGDLRLQEMSPCVNSGTNQSWMVNSTDMDANTRIHSGAVDMGAYESLYDKAGQWIRDFLPASGKMISQSETVSLSARGGNSGNPVSFTSLPGSPIVWVNSTTMQFSATGDVYIVAGQAGSSNYYTASSVTNHYIICHPGPFYADASRPDDTGDGLSWQTAKQTIQAAVDLAADGATVWVTNGVYDAGGVVIPGYFLTNRVYIANAIAVRSVNGAAVTTIKGNGPLGGSAVRCAYLSADAVLDGFTITNGHTSADAYIDDGSGVVSLNGLGSRDAHGGGVFLSQGSVVKNCQIVNNSSVRAGGGAFCADGILDGCLVARNDVGLIETNDVVFFDQHSLMITTKKGDGGGVYMDGGGMMQNCTLSKNSARRNGEEGFSTFYNGSGMGGGVYCPDNGTVNNCILFSNEAFYGNDAYALGSGATFHNTASGDILAGLGNITNAPLFVDSANGDFRLQSNSPCINWGDNSVVTNSTDLAGKPRIVEGTVDMGAYEYQGTIGLADSDNDGINDGWERAHGGNQKPDATCSNGVNSILQAYIAGLDPKNPQSRFQMAAEKSPASENVLRWNATSGRVYAVYYSTNLISGFQPLASNIPWTAGCFTDSVHNASGQLFYKIDVRLGE